MSAVTTLLKKMLHKIFVGVYEEEKEAGSTEPINAVKLGIYYKNGAHKYCRFNNAGEIIRDIDQENYLNFIDIDIFNGSIDATMGQLGAEYAKNLACDINDLKLVLTYNDKDNFECATQKTNRKAAGLFSKAPVCECKICAQAGLPYGELYKGAEKVQDIIFNQILAGAAT